MLVVVGRLDQVGAVFGRERAGLELFQVGDGLQHVAVGITLFRGQFEQHDRDVGIDQMRGNLGAHDTGTEHGNLAHHQRICRHD